MDLLVDAAPGVTLWARWCPATGARPGEPVLLVMGANASGVTWPEAFVAQLAEHHPVIRYDHRDTGRSTTCVDEDGEVPYGATELAADAIAVLDAFGVERAHLVGMGLGGLLVQLLLLDHPERIATATLVATGALPGIERSEPPPGPDPALLRMWAELDDLRDAAGELEWRVEHWRRRNGDGTPFDPAEFRDVEERVIAHAGHAEAAVAHARMATDGLGRGAELAGVTVPTLIIEGPADPVYPPPNSSQLAGAIGAARLVRIPGMGHAITAAVSTPLAAAILSQTARTAS